MNSLAPTHDPHADEQASLWAARLSDDSLSTSDRAELDAWLAENPARRALLAHYRSLSDNLGEQLPALVGAGVVAMPAAPAAPRRFWTPAWIGATMATAAAAVALGLWIAPAGRQIEHVAANAGQRQSFTLTDGTRVELNAQTRLQVETSRGERHVRFTDGEAYFAVSKDPSRPFIVETPAGSVRVTGTIFNVRTDSASTLEVTVVEGSVQVQPAGRAPEALHAKDQLIADGKGVKTHALSTDALADALAWRRGKIVFENTPLREAIARVAHFHGRVITLSPAAEQAGKTLGGYYSVDNLDSCLADIAQAMELSVAVGVNGEVRVSLRSER